MSKGTLFKRIGRRLKDLGANKAGVFGSYARGEAKAKSDLDLLVEFKDRKSLLQLVQIEQSLTEEFGVKVDLLTEAAISPYLIERIKKETIPI
jgi:predicted nucleotidyltransferase